MSRFPKSPHADPADLGFTNDPPTLTDIKTMRAKFNELVLAARR